jgi:alpha-soluble NSF attachment protein
MRMPQIYTPKQQMHSECRSRVRHRSLHPHMPITLANKPPAKEAGIAFERAAAIQTKNLSEPDDAANTLVEAFKVYRKTDPEDAARVIDFAINHYTAKGNFRRAATHKQNQAEVYEEMGDMKKAIEAYELAASWFESDNAEA